MTNAHKAAIRARVIALVTDPETRGQTGVEIARQAGCSRATVSRIENDLRAEGHEIPARQNLGRPPIASPKRPGLLTRAEAMKAREKLRDYLDSSPEALDIEDAAIGRRFRLSSKCVRQTWQEIFNRRDAQQLQEVAGG